MIGNHKNLYHWGALGKEILFLFIFLCYFCRNCQSHVCFADDIKLFITATQTQLQVMMRVIHKFCSVLDKKGSLQKSRMLVSSNINPTRAKELSCAAYMSLTNDFGKYLGTHMFHSRVKRATYSDLCSKLLRKLEHWSNKFLFNGWESFLSASSY